MQEQVARADFRKRTLLQLIKPAHLAATMVLFTFAWFWFRYPEGVNTAAPGFRYNYFAILLYGVIVFFFLRTYNSYLLGYCRIRSLVSAQIISQVFSVVILYVVVSIAWARFHNPLVFLVMLTAQLVTDVLWCYSANAVFFRVYPQRKTVLIYREPLDKLRFGFIQGKPTERLYKITDEIMYDGSFRDLEERLAGYDAVFVAGVNSHCRNGILKYC